MTCGIASYFEFYPGSDDTLKINLKTKDSEGCVEIFALVSGDVLTVTLPTSTGFLELTGVRVVVDSLPYGQIHIDLTAAETTDLVSGTIQIKIVRGTLTKYAFVRNGLLKLNLSDC